jgi:Ca2+-transporting ATPase
MVLLDDRLSSLFKAITQGRLIYENLRKAGSYVTAIHIPIAGAVLMSTLTGQNTLLEPVHILFLQMIIDPACAFVYETETAEKDLMHREPRNINEAFMSASFLTLSIFQGIGLWFAIIIVFGIHLYRPDLINSSEVTGIIFISLALGSMALMISKRSNQQSLWQILKNPSKAQTWLLVCMSLSLILIIQFDFLREEFKFSLLNTHQAILIALVSIATLGWFEWVKYLYRKRIG